MTRTRSQRARQGFTILELMVALTAGLILISAVYYIGAGSARHFQEQQRIAQTQMNVRMAMENIRNDVARAGYLGTPNTLTARLCPGFANVQTQAIEFLNDANNANIANGAENLSRTDRLRLVGNYASGDEYMVWEISGGGMQVRLQPQWQAYRRSFLQRNGTVAAGAFTEVFRPGRAVRLTSSSQFQFFATITAVNEGASTINIAPALPVPGNNGCMPGFGENTTIAPLSRIEYSVQTATSAPGLDLSALVPRNPQVTGPPAFLVRREIDFTAAPATLPLGSTRVVLEWVADFEVDFVFDTAPTPPPNLQLLQGDSLAGQLNPVAGAPGATPQNVRSVIVQVSGRTPEQDPLFTFVPRASVNQPMRSFRAFPAPRKGAARVRTLRSEIFLPNLAR